MADQLFYRSPVLDLQKCSFNGEFFPATSIEVVGGIRDHIHEYPHADGGAPEKMGRKLYGIRIHGDFQSTFRAYPKLWPDGLRKIRRYCERQLTADLVVPTLGTIKAYARTWTQTLNPKASMSGESVAFEFVEDDVDGAIAKVTAFLKTRPLDALAKTFDSTKVLTDFASEKDISIFDAITNGINAILAIGDQGGVVVGLVTAKILVVMDLCAQFSNTFTAKNCKNAPMAQAFHDMWDTIGQSSFNLLKKTATPKVFYTSSRMSMSMVSMAIYGDATHLSELLQLNIVEDPYAIPAGTKITYYASTKTLSGGYVDVVSTNPRPSSTFT